MSDSTEAKQKTAHTAGWQPIETAPKDGTNILLGHGMAVFDGWWHVDLSAWVDGCTNSYDDLTEYDATHWMPLPARPSTIAAAPDTAAERDRLREINAELVEALKQQIGECFDPQCEMCARHELVITKAEGK